MPIADAGVAAVRFARTRWRHRWSDRAALLTWQERRLRAFLRDRVPRAPFYGRPVSRLEELPIVDKQTHIAHFDALNTRGLRRDEAMAIALAAERSRDFRPELGDLTIGLSSGTSGERGLFVVSGRERLVWAAAILAGVLTRESLTQIASPWRPPLSVAFFLRANSNLYATLASRRVAFRFYDLVTPFDAHLAALAANPPHVLVAPATVLRRLADATLAGALSIQPRQVISVAETLEPDDEAVISRAYDRPVQQIYQATEGYLGHTCSAGRLHLNESCVHVEPEWLDAARTRFHPIVTDFTRETQLIVRYRLDDVLRVSASPCPCGRVTLALDGVDGRRDSVLLLPARSGGQPIAIFPDLVRRAMAIGGEGVRDYRLVQTGAALVIRLKSSPSDASAAIRRELQSLFATQGVVAPSITFAPWQDDPPGVKCRRIQRVADVALGVPEVVA